jgi:3-isopropylmalate dehydrogenase
MKLTIALIPGDGIGPEVTAQAKKALEAVAEVYNHIFLYTEAQMGACAIEATGNPLPDETIKICKKADAILFGAIGDPKYDNDPTAKVRPEQGLLRLRQELGLYCNVRPVRAYEKLIKNSPLKREVILGTDIAIYRELSGGIYSGNKELSQDKQSAFDVCSYTVEEISRVAHLAFKAAQNRKKKVTLVDKSNVLETSRLWRKTVT